MKRFWKSAIMVTAGEHHTVELDGRKVKLPSGTVLATPSQKLAAAIAREWAEAPPDFSPDDLPLTRLASTAQERIGPHRAEIVQQLAAYGMNDLLCYRAATPDDLAARQAKFWGGWLAWAAATHGIELQSTAGLLPIDQPPAVAARLHDIVSSCSNETIAALGVIVPALGSLVLGLALVHKAVTPEAACETACLDELWQEEQWGADEEALLRRTKIMADVAISTRFMYLCG